MKPTSQLLLAIAGLTLAHGSLQAQDLFFGLQGTVALPTSDLSKEQVLDNAPGYGIGAHMMIGFQGGHAVIPRLDYTYFEKTSPTRKVQMLQIGADYNYFFSGHINNGCYIGGGAGFGMAKFEMRTASLSDEDTPNTGYASASAGYMFTPKMGAELRYVWAKYKPEIFGGKPEITSPTINATFIYRF